MWTLAAAVTLLWVSGTTAHAGSGSGPLLQIYIEGADYDNVSESWVLSPSGSSVGEPFRLWAIGRTEQKRIYDVKLAASYDASWGELIFDIQPSRTFFYGGYYDFSTPQDPVKTQFRDDGSTPKLTDGRDLPRHDTFGPGTNWTEFALGDFTRRDSPVNDFIDSFPDLTGTFQWPAGQINVYEISVTTADGGSAHGAQIDFDLYDNVQSGNRARSVFAPFSHDGAGTVNVIPSPSTAFAALSLLAAFAATRRRRPAPNAAGPAGK